MVDDDCGAESVSSRSVYLEELPTVEEIAVESIFDHTIGQHLALHRRRWYIRCPESKRFPSHLPRHDLEELMKGLFRNVCWDRAFDGGKDAEGLVKRWWDDHEIETGGDELDLQDENLFQRQLDRRPSPT